jgi:PAS domain-containing protein
MMGHLGSVTGLRSNGEEFPSEASISHAEVGGQKLYSVIMRDITERIEAERELQRSRDQLDIILKGITDGITVQDRTGRLVYANDTGLAAGAA